MINREKVFALTVKDLKTEKEQMMSRITELTEQLQMQSDIALVDALAEICLYIERIRYIRGISQKEIEDEMNYRCLMMKRREDERNGSDAGTN